MKFWLIILLMLGVSDQVHFEVLNNSDSVLKQSTMKVVVSLVIAVFVFFGMSSLAFSLPVQLSYHNV